MAKISNLEREFDVACSQANLPVSTAPFHEDNNEVSQMVEGQHAKSWSKAMVGFNGIVDPGDTDGVGEI